jgi:hypothetical protein
VTFDTDVEILCWEHDTSSFVRFDLSRRVEVQRQFRSVRSAINKGASRSGWTLASGMRHHWCVYGDLERAAIRITREWDCVPSPNDSSAVSFVTGGAIVEWSPNTPTRIVLDRFPAGHRLDAVLAGVALIRLDEQISMLDLRSGMTSPMPFERADTCASNATTAVLRDPRGDWLAILSGTSTELEHVPSPAGYRWKHATRAAISPDSAMVAAVVEPRPSDATLEQSTFDQSRLNRISFDMASADRPACRLALVRPDVNLVAVLSHEIYSSNPDPIWLDTDRLMVYAAGSGRLSVVDVSTERVSSEISSSLMPLALVES